MHRHIQGDTLYMCEQFDVDSKLYVEVIWTFYLKGLRMILSECEVCGVKTVGGVC